MGVDGSNGSFDNRSPGPEFNRAEMLKKAKDSLIKVDFLNQNPEKRNEIKEEVDRVFKDYFGFESLDEVIGTAQDGNNLRQKEAKEKLEEIPKVVVGSMLESVGGLDEEFFLGPDHVIGLLPEGLKKVGNRVAEVFIPDKKINDSLNRIEEERRECRHEDGGKATLSHFISKTLEKDIRPELEKIEDSKQRFRVRRAVIALDHENTVLKGELGDTRVGGAEGYDERAIKRPVQKEANGEKAPSKEPTIKQKLDVLIKINTDLSTNINNSEGMTTEQAGKIIEILGDVAQNTSEINGATPEQISSLVQNVDQIAKKIGQIGMTEEQISKVVQYLEKIEEKVPTKQQVRTELDILRNIEVNTAKTAEEVALANEKLSKLVNIGDGIRVDLSTIKTTVESTFLTQILATVKDHHDKNRKPGDPELDMSQVEKMYENLSKEADDPTLDADKSDNERLERRGKRREFVAELKWLGVYMQMRKKFEGEKAVLRGSGESDGKDNGENNGSGHNKNNEGLRTKEYDWDGRIEKLYEKLRSIETSGRDMADLSTNADKFGTLFHVANGDFDKEIMALYTHKKNEYNFKGVKGLEYITNFEQKHLDILKNDIKQRLLIHASYLPSSKCSSTEDICRVVSTLHEGDINGLQDKELLEFIFNKIAGFGTEKGVGLMQIPSDFAWNMRQYGYFRPVELMEDMRDSVGFWKHLTSNYDRDTNKGTKELYKEFYNELLRRIIKEKKEDKPENGWSDLTDEQIERKKPELFVVQNGEAETEFSKAYKKYFTVDSSQYSKDIEIYKNVEFGLGKSMYKNFYMLEKGGQLKGKLMEEFMIFHIMKDRNCDRETAEIAFDLAHKVSVLTFMDSCANLAFAQDDYAEELNFKLLRIADGPNNKEGRPPKNKGVGSPDTIGDIESLVNHVLDLSRKNDSPLISVNDPRYAEDFDFSQWSPTNGMLYHFFGVVASQVDFIKDAIYNKFTAKDVNSPNFLNKIFSKFNKTAYDMCRSGIRSYYETDSYYGNIRKDYKKQADVAEELRRVWIRNIFALARDKRNGWNMGELKTFISALYRSDQIIDINGKATSFIAKDKLKQDIRASRIYFLVPA